MFQKKIGYICFIFLCTALFMTGCTSKKNMDKASSFAEAEAGLAKQAAVEESTETETEFSEAEADVTEGPGAGYMETEAAGPEKKAEAFAEQIQEAVSDRDLEALADLLTYPCIFITGDMETLTIEKREDLVKENPDKVFGDDLMVSVANVDTADLEIRDQTVILGEGESNITFKEYDNGSLGIIKIRE